MPAAPVGITRLASGQVLITYDDGSQFFAMPVIPLAEDGSFQTSSKDSGGPGGGVVGAMTVANGQDVTQGATTDTAVTTDINGTIAGRLRGLVKLLADVWDSTNHRLRVDGSGVTQPVSAASLPLPTSAATLAAQTAQTAVLNALAVGVAHHAATRLTVASSSASLAARPTRTRVLFAAPTGNTADIVIEASGYHLEKGKALELRVVDAFAFTGTDGDHLDLIEEWN